MKSIIYKITVIIAVILVSITTKAQDLSQAPANYGLTGVLDGAVPGPGFYSFEYAQYYSGTLQDFNGNDVKPNGTDELKISSMLLMNQGVWVTKTKVLGGNLLFDALVPIVLLDSKDPYDLIGKSGIGDIIVGTGIQWFESKLFGLPFPNRFELDFVLPIGSYNDEGGTKPINASSRFLSVEPYWAATLFFNKEFSFSMRNHLTFNGKYKEIPNTEVQVGANYHLNYSLEHLIGKSRFVPGQSGEFRLGIQGYLAEQLANDKVNGVELANSKESVFAVGPVLQLQTKSGWFLALKTAFEVSAKNRPQGTRTTLRFIKYFPPKPKKQMPAE
tara:strand:+ start:7131 stop:8120 length:990 start_codon:yes stop_codon:yes gene_type:complete